MIPHDTTMVTNRLTLTALTVDHADEMVHVMSDDRLHEFIGGEPASLDELRDRYRRFVVGSNEPGGIWLNWIVSLTHDQIAVGTMQATISSTAGGQSSADVAWIIGTPWQNKGYASEAAEHSSAGYAATASTTSPLTSIPTTMRRPSSPAGPAFGRPTNDTTAKPSGGTRDGLCLVQGRPDVLTGQRAAMGTDTVHGDLEDRVRMDAVSTSRRQARMSPGQPQRQ